MSLCLFLRYHTQLLFHYYYSFHGNRTRRNQYANILNFIDDGAEFEKNLCAEYEFLFNRGCSVRKIGDSDFVEGTFATD